MERFANAIYKRFFKKRPQGEKSKSRKQLQLNSVQQKTNVTLTKSSETLLTDAEIQFLLDNIVYPEDIDKSDVELESKKSELKESTSECNPKDSYSEEEIIQNIVYDQCKSKESKTAIEVRQKLSKKFTTADFAKHMPTFWRLQRKLQKIENLYPELYYRDQNIIEMFANSETVPCADSTILRYDVDDSDFVWI